MADEGIDELVGETPLAQRAAILEASSAPDRDSRLAIVQSLLGRRDEAAVTAWRAEQARAPGCAAALALVALASGDARRALVAADRRSSPDVLAEALAAEALEQLGEPEAADARLASLAPEHAYVRVALASIALGRGDTPRVHHLLEGEQVTGLLGARARRLRAEAWLGQAMRDERRARDEVSAAVWRLVRLGAPAELGRSYLLMAEIETALGGAREQAARWLARAHPLLARAGTPADEERLRRAFRRHGRRGIDRLVDADLERVIEGTRRALARAADLAGAAHDLHARGESAEAVGSELRALIGSLGQQSEELVASLELALVDREEMGKLVDVCRELLVRQDPALLDAELPRLALLLGGEAAELHRSEGGRFFLVAGAGPWPEGARPRQDELTRAASSPNVLLVPQPSARVALVPIATGMPAETADATTPAALARTPSAAIGSGAGARVLAIRRTQQRTGSASRDEQRLAILASVATAAYETASASVALREAAARDATTLESIREGILTLDAAGRVRSLNTAAAAAMGVLREEAIGAQLAALPGLGPLAEAITRGLEDEPVRLPKVDVLVRARTYAGGIVATLSELERARQLAHRLVGSEARFTFEDLVGRDPAFLEVIADARRVAVADVPALVTGESGTGKELFAQAIHNASPRAGQPFVGVNVAAIPRELLESELFGYEAGAFTGARARGHPGRFELADRGTILLDEIGDMPLEMQAKLLRVLQERSVVRLGGTRAIPVRARLIATTHRDLEQAVKEGSFRLDLFYRLRVVHLRLPPLRARRGDVAVLTRHHLDRVAARLGRGPIDVAPSVMADLERYPWPGNVRELANLLEGVASLLPAAESTLRVTPPTVRRALAPHGSERPPPPSAEQVRSPAAAGSPPPIEPLEVTERRAIEAALAACNGNVAQAARALGVARNTLYNKLARYGSKLMPNS